MSVYFSTWGRIGNTVSSETVFLCSECGALVPAAGTDNHVGFHGDIEGVDDTLGFGASDIEGRMRRMDAADDALARQRPGYAVSPQTKVLHLEGGMRIAGRTSIATTQCGVMLRDTWEVTGDLQSAYYAQSCSKCFAPPKESE